MTAPKFKFSEAPVKKVAAYPIEVFIVKSESTAAVVGQIVRLTDLGFLVKVDINQFYKVGESYQVVFVLPVVGVEVAANTRVVKTYDGLDVVDNKQVKSRTIEMHFKNLNSIDIASINSYLVKSGQKK